MQRFNQRQGFLVSAIVHLSVLMVLLSRVEKMAPSQPEPPPPEQTAKVFMPPPSVLRELAPVKPRPVAPPSPQATPIPAPNVPAPDPRKDRVSVGSTPKDRAVLDMPRDADFKKEVPLGDKGTFRERGSPPSPPVASPRPESGRRAEAMPNVGDEDVRRMRPQLPDPFKEPFAAKPGVMAPPASGPITHALQALRETPPQANSTGSIGLPSGSDMIRQLLPSAYDTQGADFTDWLNRFKNEAYRNWVLPPSVLWGASKGRGVVEVTVHRDGSISSVQILVSSGNAALDRSVVNAFRSSVLLPLPVDYRPSSFPIRVLFQVNEGPQAS